MKIFYIYFLLFLSFISFNCTKKENFRYSEIQQKRVNNFDSGYKEYCNLDLNSNFELNAVLCSFYGDYQNALDQATKRESVAINGNISHNGNKTDLIYSLETTIQNPNVDAHSKVSAQKMLDLLNGPAVNEIFVHAKPVSAVEFIIEEAKDFHFTLINEAHYNSQHRSFTYDLLKPLWDIGYKYLALETLSYSDYNIYERGYPIKSTGYYTNDSSFGNLVREALRIGYKLVPYETQEKHDGTLRDQDQGKNIDDQTWKLDKNGKVLVHAGYSHISEMGDTKYRPMGYQLKRLTNQDILTIDQVLMIGLPDTTKQHPYYRDASIHFNFAEPTIFLTKKDKVIIDPVNSFGIDLQVYHPETKFEYGRPDWMNKNDI